MTSSSGFGRGLTGQSKMWASSAQTPFSSQFMMIKLSGTTQEHRDQYDLLEYLSVFVCKCLKLFSDIIQCKNGANILNIIQKYGFLISKRPETISLHRE